MYCQSLKLSFGLLSRAWFQICWRFYFPMLSLRVDSSTLIRIYSFFDSCYEVLDCPHYTKVFHFSLMACCCLMVMNGGWGLKVFFELLSKYFVKLSNILMVTVYPVILELCITLLFCMMMSLPLGGTRRFFNVLPLLKCVWSPCFLQMVLML